MICEHCNRGSLLLVGRPGRLAWCDGATVEIPRDFLIPTCDQCGAEELDETREASLWAAVATARLAALRAAHTEKMEIVATAPPTVAAPASDDG